MYYAHDNRSTSSFVIASIAERSFFGALHTNIVAKSTIVGQNKCACKVEKSTLLLCSTVHIHVCDHDCSVADVMSRDRKSVV